MGGEEGGRGGVGGEGEIHNRVDLAVDNKKYDCV